MSIIIPLAFMFCFCIGLGFRPLDWIFLISLSGVIVFAFAFCNLYPGAAPFFIPFFPPVRQIEDRIGNSILFILGDFIIRLGPDRWM